MTGIDLGAVATIVAAIVGASTVYLRLYVANELAKHEKALMHELPSSYLTQASAELRFQRIENRLQSIEGFN